MKNLKNNPLYASYLTSASMFALAGAIVYFTVEMVQITRQIPDILLTVENTSKEIGPIVSEIAAIQKQIPIIIKETEETRKLAKLAIAEYTKTNQQLPRILDEIEATRKALPDALKTADNASNAVIVISKEIEAGRLFMPQVLSEVKKTRESIPPLMDRADLLIASAREAGQEASSGAVSGLFTGILMAPFTFVGSVSETLIGDDDVSDKLSDKDNEDIEKATGELLASGSVGDVNAWSNKDSGNSGLIKLIDVTDADDGDDECREIQIVIKHKGDEIQNKKTTLCKKSDKWDLK